MLGQKVELNDASESDDSESDSDSSTMMSMSEQGEDIFSQFAAKLSTKTSMVGGMPDSTPNMKRSPFGATKPSD